MKNIEMTRSKLEFAKILAATLHPNEKAEKLQEMSEKFAAEMTLRKLCYEIEKAEEATKPPKEKPQKSLWQMLTLEDSDVE